MLFNIRGFEIDVNLPRSLQEAERRIDELTLVQCRLQDEVKRLPPKSRLRQAKGRAIQETVIELQILKRWRRNANVNLENMLANSEITNSRELRTEAGLIKHLYLELRQLTRERVISIEHGSKRATILSAAQYWLRNHYSSTFSSTELVQDLIEEDQERQRQAQLLAKQRDKAETQEALSLLSQLAKSQE